MLNIFGRRDRCEAVGEFDQAVSQPSVHYRASQQQHTLPVSKSQLEEKYHCQSCQEPPPKPTFVCLSSSVRSQNRHIYCSSICMNVYICHSYSCFHFLVKTCFFKRYCINKGIVIIIIIIFILISAVRF